jgi:hypothetical protein
VAFALCAGLVAGGAHAAIVLSGGSAFAGFAVMMLGAFGSGLTLAGYKEECNALREERRRLREEERKLLESPLP